MHYKSVFGGEFIMLSRFSEMPPQEGMKLSEGGKVSMPMDKTFWGSYFGMFTDRFDLDWMISFGEKPEE